MILVFGQTGQVASELQSLAPDGTAFLSRHEADLSDPASCAEAITARRPAAVINAAAYTAVDRAEEDQDVAHQVNGAAPGAMARACSELSIPFVHISTDYVFAGTGTAPWRPEDPTGPLGVYGRSKLAGEQAIAQAGGQWAVLRTSWVFSGHGNNFLKTMLRLSQTRDALNIVEDQIGGPTPADAIAEACLTMVTQMREDPSLGGVYHFAGAPEASWKDFAEEIFARAGRAVSMSGIPSSAYPTPAQRPLNSRLACDKLAQDFGIAQPDWRAGIDRALVHLAD